MHSWSGRGGGVDVERALEAVRDSSVPWSARPSGELYLDPSFASWTATDTPHCLPPPPLHRAHPPRPDTHTMAMRLATSRPLAAAARSTAARAFSTTALRAKEIAGENTQTPNMRVG